MVSAEGAVSKKADRLGRPLPGDPPGSGPRAPEGPAGRRDPAPGSEGGPGAEGPRRAPARPDPGAEGRLSGTLADSRLETTCGNSFPDRARRGSPKSEVLHTDVMKGSGEPQPDLQLSRSLESTFQSLLELKKAGRPAASAPARSGAAELDFPSFSPAASQDHCLEGFVPDHSEGAGAVETDSVLEAAVNSILEC